MKTRIHSAFTLIELLTVIAIIGVLAGILLPVTSRVRESARNAQCISNLRQIGTSLQLYLDEHRDTYPGPLYTVQSFYFTGDPDGTGFINLSRRLSPYLSSHVVPGNKRKVPVFICPSWELVMKNVSDAEYPYVINLDPKYPDGVTKWSNSKQPFGDANGPKPPHRASEFTDCPRSQTWMLSELDKKRSSRTDPMPEKPVHGSHRNELYYDYHVARAAVK
ncbi:DUF1559 domain-containing protein [Geminisphaera colitermitum]|uniref:DUF1559 family PulG-like putative transporter n=1 Tax=Geminisphaera colitermitum TaxID=1148786 RepID=UPI000158D5BC|nr:DUF1559 domain-containing protein [Geminisphaera colitermitum]